MDFLREWAQKRGYAVAWGTVSLLDEVREELVGRHEAGEFDEDFFRQSLAGFGYLSGSQPFTARSVGVVAVPRPAHLLRFSTGSRSVEATLPPTYLNYGQTSRDVIDEMNHLVPGAGTRFAPVHAPLKALAVRLGLARYGRNNITYVPGLGSYHQLIGFVSDGEPAPGGQLESGPSALCRECEGCSTCQKACPTGAIGDDRFLLRGERCLTFLNEYEEPWPDWLPSSVHHCLVGCLICQRACPLNASLLRFERVEEAFTEDETAAILNGNRDTSQTRWQSVTAKLTRLGLDGYESVLGRNLKALLARPGRVR